VSTYFGTDTHSAIVNLIDESREFVILVSPFLRIWPELHQALARAVLRGIDIEVLVQGPRKRTWDRDLAMLEELDIEVLEVPYSHAKVYVSEREALNGSANLTADAIGRSMEALMRFERAEEGTHWLELYETAQQAIDDYTRWANEQEPPEDVAEDLGEHIRELAEQGNARARSAHRFCVVCGDTASVDDSFVACTRCRATAISQGQDWRHLAGQRCTVCGGSSTTSPRRPRCSGCFDELRKVPSRSQPKWFVRGTAGRVQVWSRASFDWGMGPTLPESVADAIRSRLHVLLHEPKAVSVRVASPKSLSDLLLVALSPGQIDVEGIGRIRVERVGVRDVPLCGELGGSAVALYSDYSSSYEEIFDAWTTEAPLASWNFETQMDLATAGHGLTLAVMIRSRDTLNTQVQLPEPERVGLAVEMELAGPHGRPNEDPHAGLLPRNPTFLDWRSAASRLIHGMVASLHSYESEDIAPHLARLEPQQAEVIRSRLVMDAPLGTTKVQVDKSGTFLGWTSRVDRVAAIRIRYQPAEHWTLKASVSRALRRKVH